jgi:iron(III) transport system permease protein
MSASSALIERLPARSSDSDIALTLLSGAVATLVLSPILWLVLRTLDVRSETFAILTYCSAWTGSRLSRLFERAPYVPTLYQTLQLLIFAYVVRFLPQAVGATPSSALQVDLKLVEAGRTLGDTALGAFRWLTVPLITPGIVAGAALVFLTTTNELPTTLLLHLTGFNALVSYNWQVQSAGYYGQAAVPALVLVGVSALSMVVLLSREAVQDG